jgi:hypothetical protein
MPLEAFPSVPDALRSLDGQTAILITDQVRTRTVFGFSSTDMDPRKSKQCPQIQAPPGDFSIPLRFLFLKNNFNF